MMTPGPTRERARCGMTLIELVVSALLAALMMTALTSIVWSAARDTTLLRKEAADQFPITQLAQQMRTDFANSRGMSIDPLGITLHGFLGSDPQTHRPMLTPGRVRYELGRVANQSVLIRTGSESREPVWYGCSSLHIESMDQTDAEDRLLPSAESGGLPPMPTRFRVTMIGEDGHIIWSEVIHHHED